MNALRQRVLAKCPCFSGAPICSVSTPSSHSNQTLISWMHWWGKKQRSGRLRALEGFQCHNGKTRSLEGEAAGKKKKKKTVSMTTSTLTQLSGAHLNQITVIRKQFVLYDSDGIVKYSVLLAAADHLWMWKQQAHWKRDFL